MYIVIRYPDGKPQFSTYWGPFNTRELAKQWINTETSIPASLLTGTQLSYQYVIVKLNPV